MHVQLVLRQANEHIVTFHFHFMTDGCFGCRHGERFAGANIEHRAVPWAGDAVPLKRAVTKGPTIVRTDVVNTVPLAVNMKQDDNTLVKLKCHAAWVRET